MAFGVADVEAAYAEALKRGAVAADASKTVLGEGARVLEGIGGSMLYLVEGPEAVFASWTPVAGAAEAEAANNVGLDLLDHLTHNVKRGQMRTWSTFYRDALRLRGAEVFRHQGPGHRPVQPGDDRPRQGHPHPAQREPGRQEPDRGVHPPVQRRGHPAPGPDHGRHLRHRRALRARGVKLQDTIETYYELVDKRVPGHGEDLERLRKNRILLDGNVGEEGLLLQIFTENLFGPIFFEIIQRKGNEGFGNGNFQALFESIELDQIRRGVITVEA
jgi:4-hydroxyphenylpyruvate dioxygenase